MRENISVRSFGAPKNTAGTLNIVMPRKAFRDAGQLPDFLEKLLEKGEFDKNFPHVFLFSETPFPAGYVPRRVEVKKAVEKIGELLKERHPHSMVAFSVNELLKEGDKRSARLAEKITHHSNTGYLIHATGYKAYPKLVDSNVDEDKMRLLNATHQSYKVASKRWQRRGAKIAQKTMPFPQITAQSGHELQYRVCADATENFPAGRITILSADQLPERSVYSLASNAELLVVNDGYGDRRAYFGSPSFPDSFESNAHNSSSVHAKLGELKVRIHLVD